MVIFSWLVAQVKDYYTQLKYFFAGALWAIFSFENWWLNGLYGAQAKGYTVRIPGRTIIMLLDYYACRCKSLMRTRVASRSISFRRVIYREVGAEMAIRGELFWQYAETSKGWATFVQGDNHWVGWQWNHCKSDSSHPGEEFQNCLHCEQE